MPGPHAVPYTEFKSQVAKAQRRRGVRARRHHPGRAAARRRRCPSASSRVAGRKYKRSPPSGRRSPRTTCWRELAQSGATVRATPLVQQRGVLTNLLISFAPIAAAGRLLLWMFKRQQSCDGRGCSAARRASPSIPRRCASPSTTSPASTRSRPRSTRSSTSCKRPGEVPAARRARAQGRAAGRRARHRQDAARARDRGRGQACRSSAPAPPSSSR